MSSPMQVDASTPKSPKGLNGRLMVAIVGIGMLLVTLTIGYIIWLYGEVEDAHKATTIAWREVANELAPRYRALEKLVAEGVDNRQLAMEFGERFRLGIDTFRATGQADQQVAAVNEIEQLLSEIEQEVGQNTQAASLTERWTSGMARSPKLLAAVENYNQCVREQRDWRSTFGGALLLAFIKVSEPQEVQIVAVLANNRIQ